MATISYEAVCRICGKTFKVERQGSRTHYKRRTCSPGCARKARGQSELPAKREAEPPPAPPEQRSFRQLEAIAELPEDIRKRLGIELREPRGRVLDTGPSGPRRSEEQ